MRNAGVDPGFSEGGGGGNMGRGTVQERGECGRGEGAGDLEGVCLLPHKARKLLPLAKDFVSEIINCMAFWIITFS